MKNEIQLFVGRIFPVPYEADECLPIWKGLQRVLSAAWFSRPVRYCSAISAKHERRKEKADVVRCLGTAATARLENKKLADLAGKRSSRLVRMSLKTDGKLRHCVRVSSNLLRWSDREESEPHSSKASRITTGGLRH
jgi:hypothetical protein